VYTYGPRPFPEKQKNFDYAIGSIEQILNSYGVDALLFVYGVDENASGGRKALIAAGIIAGVIPRAGMTAMNMALVDKSGSILWFNVKRSEGRYDLRKTENATEFTKDILSDFPRFEK
jgi:hypothetical protein